MPVPCAAMDDEDLRRWHAELDAVASELAHLDEFHTPAAAPDLSQTTDPRPGSQP